MNSLTIENIQDLILDIQNKKVLLDSDVAKLYGVETKRINEAVKNNSDKFPEEYLFELSKKELEILRTKNPTAKLSKTRVLLKVFTERGLYMLATILKSTQATETTFAIIETFYKVKLLSNTLKELPSVTDKKQQ